MWPVSMKKPFLTVIVTAFRRRDFLLETLSSLEWQSADRNDIEVIVIKDFDDSEADSKIAANHWISMHSSSEMIGPFITEAIERSSGDVISFLDDDDIFEPEKLATVMNVFRSHPEVGYYHNSASFIKEAGKQIEAPYSFNFSTAKEPDGERVISRKDVAANANKLIRMRIDFNKSCISVRRDVLMPYIGISRQMPSGYDSFIFFCAAFSNFSILSDNRRLTRYRFNRKSVSITSTYRFSSRQIKTHMLMKKMALDAGHKEIANLLERQILFFRTINAIHNPVESRQEVIRTALSFIRHDNDYSRMGNTFAGILSMAYIVSPRLSKRIYSKLTSPET